jgi:CRISPR-associated protein Cmr4
VLYESAVLLFIRALTPIHVGIGRMEGYHVDLPVQRDEFDYPVIWASSLKGAIKANISSSKPSSILKESLGSEPGVVPTRPSSISVLDARLLLMPGRVLDSVWTYVTTAHLLTYLERYVEVYNEVNKSSKLSLNLSEFKQLNKALFSKGGKILVNEVEIETEKLQQDFLDKTGLKSALPQEVVKNIEDKGLLILPEVWNRGLGVINKSIIVQYRVRLKTQEKTVDEGPWTEEYLPMETLFVSLVLCRKFREKSGSELCWEFKNEFNNKSLYLGGRETIGRGLVKFYTGDAFVK